MRVEENIFHVKNMTDRRKCGKRTGNSASMQVTLPAVMKIGSDRDAVFYGLEFLPCTLSGPLRN